MADKPKSKKVITLWFSPDVAQVIERSAEKRQLSPPKYLLELAARDLSKAAKHSPKH